MPNFVLPILTTAARLTKSNFVKKTQQALVVQEQFLRNLLFAHQDTELGQKYGLKNIKTIAQFREQDELRLCGPDLVRGRHTAGLRRRLAWWSHP